MTHEPNCLPCLYKLKLEKFKQAELVVLAKQKAKQTNTTYAVVYDNEDKRLLTKTLDSALNDVEQFEIKEIVMPF